MADEMFDYCLSDIESLDLNSPWEDYKGPGPENLQLVDKTQ